MHQGWQDLISRVVDELDALLGVYGEEYVMLSEPEAQALASARLLAVGELPGWVDDDCEVPTLSGRVRLPEATLLGSAVALRWQLPAGYPDVVPHLSVECAAPKALHQTLEDAVRSCAAEAAGAESLLLAAECLREHVQQLAEEQPSLAHTPASSSCQDAHAGAGSSGGGCAVPVMMIRAVIWFHHIKSTTKRKAIVGSARDMNVRGCSKPGFPGIIVCEGLERDVRSFIAEVRALSWQAMQVRAEEVLPPPGVGAAGASAGAPSRADGQQEAAAQPAGGRLGGQQQAQGQGRHWCFADPFFELPETGMSEMSQLCREGGIEHLFLAALKLDKS